ncbi:MAG TPA: glycosyltransferase [Steroidobacteraceae bacterium]|nr:glycosyltransferase [Steroidobacteraceae bacterium]
MPAALLTLAHGMPASHWLLWARRGVAALPLLIWIYLLTARGGFWRVARLLNPYQPAADSPPLRRSGQARHVVAIIPARNEAASIGDTVLSLLRQDFDGSLHLIVVDDGSTDDTVALAVAAAEGLGASARLSVLRGAPLFRGWTGKLWALRQGVQAAGLLEPDYLLLTDADIYHERTSVAGLVANAEAEQRDLVSYMVKLSTDSFAERCLIPAFVFFFFKLYPPRWAASARSSVAAAAGGCVLLRPSALLRIGGLAAIRSEIIDDCALAAAVKRSGGKLWLGLTQSAWSLRRYGSFAEIGSMISRTAFNQLRHSWLLLLATLLGLAITYLLPPLLLFSHDPLSVSFGALAWLLMSLCYLPMVRFYGLSPAWCVGLPVVAVFYAGATLHSALRYAAGRGGSWKGRVQDLGTKRST